MKLRVEHMGKRIYLLDVSEGSCLVAEFTSDKIFDERLIDAIHIAKVVNAHDDLLKVDKKPPACIICGRKPPKTFTLRDGELVPLFPPCDHKDKEGGWNHEGSS